MKNRILFALRSIFFVVSCQVQAWEEHKDTPHYVWFEEDDVYVGEDGIYADSNKGMFKLNVVEYDRGNARYKVLCRCLEDSHLDSAEALSAPLEIKSE